MFKKKVIKIKQRDLRISHTPNRLCHIPIQAHTAYCPAAESVEGWGSGNIPDLTEQRGMEPGQVRASWAFSLCAILPPASVLLSFFEEMKTHGTAAIIGKN